MSINTISSVVTGGFIQRFQGLAQQNAASSNGTKASKNAVSVADGLRFGARTLGSAVQSLNSAIGIVNLADSKLKNLLKVTEDLIGVTTQAYQTGIGPETRQRLNSEFQNLAKEFRKIVSKGKVGDFEILTEDGLAGLFKQIGLDKDKSSSVARIFKELNLIQDDSNLASEEARAKRPLGIPAAAYAAPQAGTEYFFKKITDSSVSGSALISSVNSVYVDNDSGTSVAYPVDTAGAVVNPPSITADQTLLALNEATGEYIVNSTQDITGDNSSNYQQLFLYDSSGEVIRQVTNNASATVTFVSADLSQDSNTVAYVSSSGGSRTMTAVTVAAADDYPPSVVRSHAIGATAGGTLKISNAGTYVAYSNSTTVAFERLSDGTFNAAAPTATTSVFGFSAAGTLAVSSANSVRTLAFTDGSYTFTSAASYAGITSFIEANPTSGGSAGFVKYNAGALDVYTLSGTTITNQYSGSATISGATYSLAHNLSSPGKIEVGIRGVYSGFNGDTGTEVYRLSYNPQSASGRRVGSASAEPDDLLDSSILTRPDAYRVLQDLGALKEQLTDNIDALKDIRKLVADNITLARSTGLAFLDASNTVLSSATAEEVARNLQQKIKQQGGIALDAQAENLTPLVVAALAFESSQSTT